MKANVRALVSSRATLMAVGVVLGAAAILGIRLATYQPPEETHYHANFAVYINGKREAFADPVYYADIEDSCTVKQVMTPHERAHMHDNVSDVVHVEDEAVTWGQFFQNLGWVVDPKVIRTPDATYLATDKASVSFVLNGEAVPNVVNRVIGDRDKLLVDYGVTAPQTLQQEYSTIASTAGHYDTTQDPESCSGHKEATFQDRLHHLF